MPDCFEIIHKDLAGRLGRLTTPHGTVETPALMPVVNPHLMMIKPSMLKKLGAQMLITNSYIISQDPQLREAAEEKGLHALLDFDGPIMTDSGAFQLSVYGSVEVQPLEILRFQQAIRSDVCVPLDIPTPPDVPPERAAAELRETEARLEEARASWEGDLLLAGPIQGSTYPSLREAAARKVREIGFDVCPVGGVVPLMEAYRYRDLVQVVAAAKRGLGSGAPVHLFGAGHPMVFALAAALGCDLFDSAAYAIYARDGRYLTPYGTWKLEEMKYLPCSCEVCSSHSAEELRSSPDRVSLLARHNLAASLQEIELVKQRIWEGSLWELLESRCRTHPRMLDGLKSLESMAEDLEKLDRVSKSTLFYLSPQSARRPEVVRYGRRVERIALYGRVLITDMRPSEEDRRSFDHILSFKPPFGPYPHQLAETYPLNAEVPLEPDREALEQALANARKLIQANPAASFQLRLRDVEDADSLVRP
ncbi:MAG: tRNA guanosine(15) transglycosylase TgtA [Methanosarcinales archaeon]|nr:tRNA guanosine(15) transglycosylase TgtA [Methanosarcinales archaeon]